MIKHAVWEKYGLCHTNTDKVPSLIVINTDCGHFIQQGEFKECLSKECICISAKHGMKCEYRQTSNISRIFVDNIIVDNSDVVGASPFGAAPTTSSLST